MRDKEMGATFDTEKEESTVVFVRYALTELQQPGPTVAEAIRMPLLSAA